jgi:hypothetical protein
MCERRLSAKLKTMYTGNLLIDAQSAFTRERRGRRREQVTRWLTRRPRACDRLLSLDKALAGAPPAARRALGLQPIALDSIVGTTEEVKVETFDRRFRPPSISRNRWQRLWMAARSGSPLPPISVMRVGDQHFVVDGHHRVSVAHSLGMSAIDAEVTLLRAQTHA